jgi:hypothetical protein
MLLAKGWREWRTALMVVQPETVLRWRRQSLRRRWADRSKRTRPGRPSTAVTVRSLWTRWLARIPLWGAPRIHGGLRKVGIEISERTVPTAPATTGSSTLSDMANVPGQSRGKPGLFTVSTLTGRVLFVFVLLAHQRRRIVHSDHRGREMAKGNGQGRHHGPSRERSPVKSPRDVTAGEWTGEPIQPMLWHMPVEGPVIPGRHVKLFRNGRPKPSGADSPGVRASWRGRDHAEGRRTAHH